MLRAHTPQRHLIIMKYSQTFCPQLSDPPSSCLVSHLPAAHPFCQDLNAGFSPPSTPQVIMDVKEIFL